MTIFTVAVKYLRARTVASFLTALSVTLAVSLVIASVLLTRGIKEGFVEGTTDYNLVVGAKGSPTQLVLSVVFRMDVATPNILTRTFRRLQEDPRSTRPCPSRWETPSRDFATWRRGRRISRRSRGGESTSPSRKGGSLTT